MKVIKNIKKISFHTLGCKLNQAETDALSTEFSKAGYEIVPFRQASDVTVINTCTVTNEADSKSRQAIRTAVRSSPEGRIVAMGCYAQISPRELAGIEGVDLILGTGEKYRLLDHLKQLEAGKPEQPLMMISSTGEEAEYDQATFISATGRTRAYLKIQEGCNYFCSYCIIPFARGRARSSKLENAVTEARQLVENGFKELVLTGINIGTWDDGDYTLEDILEELSAVPGLARLRISSIEPNTISNRLLELVAGKENICNHLHVPLQSGADSVLERMQRKYTMQDYYHLVERIDKTGGNIALGTDLITGFPGETEAEFTATIEAVTALPFTYLHIFRYSRRDGTVAARLPLPVDYHVAKKRAAILREIGQKKKAEFARRFCGIIQPVLFEKRRKDGLFSGMTDRYIRVLVPSDRDLTNQILPVKLEQEVRGEGLGKLAVVP